jgi:hypothetical protein
MITTGTTSPTGMETEGLSAQLRGPKEIPTRGTATVTMIPAVLKEGIITTGIRIHRFVNLKQEGRIITGHSGSRK